MLHSSLLLVSLVVCRRRRRSVIEEADRQSLIRNFASRAIAAHKQCAGNGKMHNKLPKSESAITFLSDERPLTTQNPIFQDGTSSSPERNLEIRRVSGFLDSDAPSPTSPCGQFTSWSLPSRIRGRGVYSALRRQALWDPALWEEQQLKAELTDSREELDADQSGRSTETKLSVREQARQFEQQALADRTPRQSRDSYASLDTDDPLLGTIMLSYSTISVGKDSPPCIIITGGDGGTPPPPTAQRPTPPVVRKFSSSISNYMTVEPCEIMLEFISDFPESPPPSPPSLIPPRSFLSPPCLELDCTPPPTPPPIQFQEIPVCSPTFKPKGILKNADRSGFSPDVKYDNNDDVDASQSESDSCAPPSIPAE